ncbi:unnamed protein product [Penicillium camemberti]|uniref:Str. FM013 n=1 Tax=Penicillium camemberti (strain FM 013) TaxID=1429867 RepID=A0A0G4NSY7_PENC3|nr:unnamed protein product [Penicillium camemberti]
MPWDRPIGHWTRQVLKKVTRARSLVRESHQLVKSQHATGQK